MNKMTFGEYVTALTKSIRENEECIDYQVVHSADEEGNVYHPVVGIPSLGEYIERERVFNYDIELEDKKDINAVCLN